MFRCDNCGSGYSTQAASSWHSCPRCMAKDGTYVPLSFELGWRRPAQDSTPEPLVADGGRPALEARTVAG
jgi:predicted  nucleic acid-binding Zn-ribbon protein